MAWGPFFFEPPCRRDGQMVLSSHRLQLDADQLRVAGFEDPVDTPFLDGFRRSCASSQSAQPSPLAPLLGAYRTPRLGMLTLKQDAMGATAFR